MTVEHNVRRIRRAVDVAIKEADLLTTRRGGHRHTGARNPLLTVPSRRFPVPEADTTPGTPAVQGIERVGAFLSTASVTRDAPSPRQLLEAAWERGVIL